MIKQLIIAALLMGAAIFEVQGASKIVRENNTFKLEQTTDVQTPYNWEDKNGDIYPIFITKKGGCYIIKTSKKTGKPYKYYLPKSVQVQINKELNR